MKEIIMTGEWDGEPIWREKTPEETLFAAIPKENHKAAEILVAAYKKANNLE